MPLSAKEIFDELHALVPVWSDSIKTGQTKKAENVREFGQFFRPFVQVLKEDHGQVSDSEADNFKRIIFESASQREMIYRLAIATRDVFSMTCNQYMGTLEQCEEHHPHVKKRFDAFKKLHAGRLRKVRPQFSWDEKTEYVRNLQALQAIVLGGVVNVGHVSWSLFNALNEKYDNAAVKASSIQSFILQLVSCQDDVFGVVDHYLRRERVMQDEHAQRRSQQPSFYWQPYHPEDFLHDGTVGLTLVPEIIPHIRESVRQLFANGEMHLDEPRVGCAGTVMIPVVHQWCLNAARRCFFRHEDYIRSLPINGPWRPEKVAAYTQVEKAPASPSPAALNIPGVTQPASSRSSSAPPSANGAARTILIPSEIGKRFPDAALAARIVSTL